MPKRSPPKLATGPLFGAHMSIAGGLHTAFDRAAAAGCQCMQIFVKNQRQWKAAPLSDEAVAEWERVRTTAGVEPIVCHASYLINLAAPDDEIWKKSVASFADELQRCDRLGLAGIVVHPGSPGEQGESWGIRRVATALDALHAHFADTKVRILLEITAGQGSCLGCRFEHLADIMGAARQPKRLGVCFDTCHALASGYDLATPEGYEKTISEFERIIGLKHLHCLHLNDSKKPLGSRVDRHEHIGQGHVGRAAFGRIVRDPRLAGRPMLLETPKETDARGRDMDRVNLALLRSLARPTKKTQR